MIRKKRLLKCHGKRDLTLGYQLYPYKNSDIYTLNKVEFQDALSLRFNWHLQTLPKKCGGCGLKNNTDHALSCKTGGYVSFRHDAVRDVEAELLKEVCRNVKVEPPLQETRGDMLRSNANTSAQARLDIAATGLWSRFERTYFDVRVTHPNAPSNRAKSLKQLYIRNEEEKMVKYAQRVVDTEKGSFCPLVYSTFGGTAPSAHHTTRELHNSWRTRERKSTKTS